MIAAGDRSPLLAAVTYDGRNFNLGAPGRRTVLWFSPKSGLVDELGDRLTPRFTP